jgi:hypothetical protein
MKVRIKYVVEDTDRHGNVRVYLRRDGRKIRLHGPVGSPDFWREYQAALKAPPKKQGEPKTVPGTMQKGTMRWLVAQYTASGMFKQLGAKAQKDRRATLERFCNNIPRAGPSRMGNCRSINFNPSICGCVGMHWWQRQRQPTRC